MMVVWSEEWNQSFFHYNKVTPTPNSSNLKMCYKFPGDAAPTHLLREYQPVGHHRL